MIATGRNVTILEDALSGYVRTGALRIDADNVDITGIISDNNAGCGNWQTGCAR